MAISVRTVVPAVVAAAALGLSATPAAAAPSGDDMSIMSRVTCHVVTTHCESAIVQAGSGHFIDYYVVPGGFGQGCSWRVKDTSNQFIVRQGRTGAFNSTQGRIPGLYRYYRLEMYNCAPGSAGHIENT